MKEQGTLNYKYKQRHDPVMPSLTPFSAKGRSSAALICVCVWRHTYYSAYICRTLQAVFIIYNLHFYYTEKTSGHSVLSCIYPTPIIWQSVNTQSLPELYPCLGSVVKPGRLLIF